MCVSLHPVCGQVVGDTLSRDFHSHHRSVTFCQDCGQSEGLVVRVQCDHLALALSFYRGWPRATRPWFDEADLNFYNSSKFSSGVDVSLIDDYVFHLMLRNRIYINAACFNFILLSFCIFFHLFKIYLISPSAYVEVCNDNYKSNF